MGVTCHHVFWTAHTVERRWAWHAIITFGQHKWSDGVGKHTRSNYVERRMPSSPLGSKNGRTTSGVACHHHLWAAHTVERRRAWHASIALRQHTQSKDVGRGMTSPPFESTHGRTTSGVTCHPCLWTAHTVERPWAWHAIITFGQHTRSNDVGMACHHSPWTANTVEHRQA